MSLLVAKLGVSLAAFAAIMQMCREGKPLSAVASGGVLAALWNVTYTIQKFAIDTYEQVEKVIKDIWDGVRSALQAFGLDGMLGPVMDWLGSTSKQVSEWLKKTGIIGYAALAVVAYVVILTLRR